MTTLAVAPAALLLLPLLLPPRLGALHVRGRRGHPVSPPALRPRKIPAPQLWTGADGPAGLCRGQGRPAEGGLQVEDEMQPGSSLQDLRPGRGNWVYPEGGAFFSSWNRGILWPRDPTSVPSSPPAGKPSDTIYCHRTVGFGLCLPGDGFSQSGESSWRPRKPESQHVRPAGSFVR